jgi:hypothetical protein
VPLAKVTVRAVTESVPPLVTKVNASRSVMEELGATVELDGLEPLANVVVGAGVAGEPVGTTPVWE